MTNFKNCLFNVCDVPLEKFKMAKDGRKWKRAAGNRQIVLIHLAKHANADGTSARPSIAKLMAKTGFCHGKVCYLIDDLKVLGYIETVTKGFSRAGRRGAAVRKIVMPDTVQDSNSIQSKIERLEDHTVQDTSHTVQDRIHTVQQLMDTTCPTDLPYKPVNQISQLIVRLSDGFLKITGKVIGIKERDYQAYADLEKEYGAEVVYRSVKEFANANHNWDLVKNPSRLYLSDPSEYLTIARRKQQEAQRVYETAATDWTDEFQPTEQTPEEIASRFTI